MPRWPSDWGSTLWMAAMSLRFSPAYPKKILQLSSSKMMLRDTQKQFYALDLNQEKYHTSTDDSVNLARLKLTEAEGDKALRHVASVYDYQSDVVRDGINYEGKKFISFAGILQHESFPLAAILKELLEIGQKEINLPIEIEFAVEMDVPEGQPYIFNFLQIRPIVETDQSSHVDMDEVNAGECHSLFAVSPGQRRIQRDQGPGLCETGQLRCSQEQGDCTCAWRPSMQSSKQ